MDIKLKNIKYSSVTKGIAVFLVWLCFMSVAASGLYLLYYQDVVGSSSYYQTRDFRYEFSRAMHDAAVYHIKFDHANDIAAETSETAKAEDKMQYEELKARLNDMVNFSYYIKNSNTGESFSNIIDAEPIEQLAKQPSYTYISSNGERNYEFWHEEDMISMLSESKAEVHGAIIEPLKKGDIFYEQYTNFSRVKAQVLYVIVLLGISIVIMLAAFIYLLYVAGRKEENGEIMVTAVDRIYTDIHALLVFVAAVISVAIVGEASNGAPATVFIAAAVLLSIDICIGLSFVLSMVRQIKSRQILKNSLTHKIFSLLRKYAGYAFNSKLFKAWIVLALLGYGAVNAVFFTAFITVGPYRNFLEFMIFGLLFLGLNVSAVYFTAKSLHNLAQIMQATQEISKGNLDYPIDSKEMTAAFEGFAENLKGIQKGLQVAVADAVKGERMKTELITNVSHDLKTPLTSIINYVDLLKKEELDNEKAQEYLLILEEKSARLKQLIEDLIEASKASSGNLTVAAEKVDLNQLVMQAYGEYEEKIEKAGLEIRTNIAEKDIWVRADGKHLWRIVENLLSNTLKYSMMNSRVYINLDKNNQCGVLTIKNISAFSLDISPEQLTERFVRGDASRTTEGSGLGLSIAQSLTHLQGGRFKVEIDGDLFKVMVELPLWRDE